MTTYDSEYIELAKAHLNTHKVEGFQSDVSATDDDAEQLLHTGWKPNVQPAKVRKSTNPLYDQIRAICAKHGVKVWKTYSDKRTFGRRVKFCVSKGFENAPKAIEEIKEVTGLELDTRGSTSVSGWMYNSLVLKIESPK